MVDATESFVTCAYASLMKLGSLDVSGLRQLLVDDDNGEVGPSSHAKITGLDDNVGKGITPLNQSETGLLYRMLYGVGCLNCATLSR
ncbi:unnamed protein product [Lactuca saligna]|uniref:Uncharacterized protein n=1 Tax=Lactuca saligna TaxID=75948 RepID=A0AA35ZID9_LACSI|nr:unnamed protein product [Lactuca saligna]